jgi:hypothetical protein
MAEETPDQSPVLITPGEMQAAIESSGYLLEGRIGRVLKERGFFVEPNCFRVDPNDASKIIEVDVHGRYFEWINEVNKDAAMASILVECKNNSQPIAFFVQPQHLTELNIGRIRYGGFPSFSMDPDTKIQEPLGNLLGMKEWHHYCQPQEIATQFCGFSRDGKRKWKTEAMSHYSKSFADVVLMAAVDSDGAFGLNLPCIQVQLAYPVVVFQGPIYRVRDVSGKATVEEASHIQLHHSAMLNARIIQAQIDVVTEAAFPSAMESILAELKTFRDRINALYPRLLNSALDQKRVAVQNSARQMQG